MWDKNLRTGSKEGFDSGVSWDQDFTINERESERPIIKVPDKQGQDGNPITRGKSTPLREEIALYAILLRDFEDKEEHAPLAWQKKRKNLLSYTISCALRCSYLYWEWPRRETLFFYCSGDTTAHLSETLPLIDWNKLTPVFPTFTHSFKDRERKRRIISPYTQSFIPAFSSERWSSTKWSSKQYFLPLRLNIYPSLVICTSKHTLDKQIKVSLNEWKS